MPSNETKKIESGPKQKGWLWPAVIAFILIIAISGAIFMFFKSINQINYIDAYIGSEQYKLELADTEAKRVKGLSERNSLGDLHGMLFDFKQDGDWRMWMVQMRFAIDIIWLDADKKVIFIKTNAKPADFPERYSAKQNSRYVIELNNGSVEQLGLKVGDKIDFSIPK
jgi:uncharacterized membrane protein (UPF0127 family)